jgi:hypothetical protein
MTSAVCLLIIVLLLYLLWGIVPWIRRHNISQLDRSSAPASGHRMLTPRTPDDCPACHRQSVRPPAAPALPPTVRPWRERKSRRGAPRRIPTVGFACPTRACVYYRITGAQIHALVGDGTHGTHESIQTFAAKRAKSHSPLGRIRPCIGSKRHHSAWATC